MLGEYMLYHLKKFCKRYPDLILNARGLGTFTAIDGVTAGIRDKIIVKLRSLGKRSPLLNYSKLEINT
jgi:4-aminobutyrate aminotransferase-like enzyme